MTTVVKIEGHFNLKSLRWHLVKFIDNEGIPLDNEFLVDVCELKFAAPVSLVALTNMFNYLIKRGCGLVLRRPKTPNRAIKYLDDSYFFDYFFQQRLFPERVSKRRNTNIPLKVLKYEEYNSWLAGTVFPWISDCLGFDIQSRWPSFATVLGEIFNNINDHAGEGGDIASAAMQHFPKNNYIDIAISDFGEGIPSRVREALPEIKDDGEAILKAVEEHFSTRSSPRNRGAGLDTIRRNTVDYNKGSVHIVSGYGQVCFRPERGASYAISHPIRYPGTLIRLILKTDTISQAEVYEEDLSW